jgi:hypothetical protein
VAVTVQELGARSGTDQQLVRRYDATGSTSEEEILDAVADFAPSTLFGLVKAGIALKETDEDGRWEVSVTYGTKTDKPYGSGSIDYKFSFQARGFHAMQSLSTTQRYIVGGTDSAGDYDTKGMIGVTLSGGEFEHQGIDLQPPAESFAIAFRPVQGFVSWPYQRAVETICGSVNSRPWYGHPTGSLMLVRCVGGASKERYKEVWQIEFGFAYMPNATGLTAGAITNIAKEGHELLWVLPKKVKTNKIVTLQPVCAYVEQVWPKTNFGILGF